MPSASLAQNLLLPELRFLNSSSRKREGHHLYAEKVSTFEVCPRCATPSSSVYDRRWVSLKDEPVRRRKACLHIRKRRFSCKPCGKPFTEPVDGVRRGARTTERYRKAVVWGCETFADLKSVRKHFRCSGGYVYDNLYPLLERRQRERLYPWPKAVGIDEHSFKRRGGRMRFATLVVDHKGRRVMEVVNGKTSAECREALEHIPGRENVRRVTLDMSDTYKSFARDFFPNAVLIADKFHVLRLLDGSLHRRRRELIGSKRTPKLRALLLKGRRNLTLAERHWLSRWLEDAPVLREVYLYKEALHRFYRTKGFERAGRALTKLTDSLATSTLPELKTLRRTLMRWRTEILEYFRTRLTNARVEGFNNVAKVVKKRAYGYRSFKTYRLALLQACA